MLKRQHITYNPYFLLPFLAWAVVGGVLLALFSRQQLFFTVNTHYSDFGDVVMYYLTWLGEGSVVIITLLALLLLRYFRNWWYFISALLCNVIPFFVQQGLKILFHAPRPRLLFYDRLWMHYRPEWPVLLQNSFPSGHSEGAFSFFCFLSLVLPERYKKLGFVFFLLALSVCYSRIYLAAHFFADVYAGSLLGGILTTIIYSVLFHYKDRLFTQKTNNK